MTPRNYTRTLALERTPQAVFDAICKVSAWWTVNTEGRTLTVGDEFGVQFSDPVSGQLVHRTVQRISEAVPGQRIVWQVTESHLPWLKDKEEWKGTTIVFDIAATAKGSQLTFTHIGLTSQVECFEQCEKGWEYFLDTSLAALINSGTGHPDTSARNHMDTIGHVHPTNA